MPPLRNRPDHVGAQMAENRQAIAITRRRPIWSEYTVDSMVVAPIATAAMMPTVSTYGRVSPSVSVP